MSGRISAESSRWRVAAVAATAVGIGLLFLAVLWEPIASSAPEMDLWWHIPTVLAQAEGRSAWGTLVYLLQPAPWMFNQPALKFFPWLIHGWLHGSFSQLVGLCVLIHGATAGLVFFAGRQMGLSHRICCYSALIFLTLFAHFHAYLWPMAVQHGVAVLTILGMLCLYLRSEQLLQDGRPGWRLFYGLTLGVAGIGSLQRSTLFAPLLVLTHLWTASSGSQERGVRYDRWMPLFLLYPLYMILDTAFVGDRVTATLIAAHPLPGGLKAGVLVAGVLVCVALGRWLIRRRFAGPLFSLLAAVGFALLLLRDKRQILFAYNALIPFASLLASFLDPFRAALGIESAAQYHRIPAQISVSVLWLTVATMALFFVLFLRRKKALWVLVVWYGVCLLYLLLHPHAASSFPIPLFSRYALYFSPVVAWICSAVFVALSDRIGGSFRMRERAQQMVCLALLVSLCGSNLLAIRVALFRGRLYNTYGIYDDIRIAELVGEEAARRQRVGSSQGRAGVTVSGMVPLDFQWELQRELAADRVAFWNLEQLTSDALRGLPVGRVTLSPATPNPGRGLVFQVVGTRVEDGQGRPIEPFSDRFEQGLAAVARGRPREAAERFRDAVALRPFLLRYLLGPCRLADLRWMTGGIGLREWLERVIRRYRAEQSVGLAKQEYTARVVRQELSDYALCLLCLSYLMDREGSAGESRRWLSQLRLLEPDPESLISWLGRLPPVVEDRHLQEFLERSSRDPLFWVDPAGAAQEDYGFGRFLMRLIFHIDIRSQWERTQVAA